jgi:hypothetical protein
VQGIADILEDLPQILWMKKSHQSNGFLECVVTLSHAWLAETGTATRQRFMLVLKTSEQFECFADRFGPDVLFLSCLHT